MPYFLQLTDATGALMADKLFTLDVNKELKLHLYSEMESVLATTVKHQLGKYLYFLHYFISFIFQTCFSRD